MKRLVLLSLLLFPIFLFAQYPTFSNKQKLGVQTTGDGLIFRGTTVNNIPNYIPSNINNAYFHLDTTTSKLYLYSVNTWQQIYPTSSDTTSLGAYLLKSDTLAMLLPYLRKSDTISLSNRINNKLNATDTVSLSNRINLKLNKTDTINLSNRIDLKLNKSDTISLSNRIDIKLNPSDTVSLSNRINKKLDTLYVNYQTNVDLLTNKDTININTLEAGAGINIVNNVISLDTTLLDSVVRVQNVYVKNGTGTVLNKGEAVYVTGANGTNIIVGRASNVAESTSSKTLGLTMTSIGVNGFGYVIKEGLLKGLNTNATTAGDPIWLGENGGLLFGLTNKPFAPKHLVYLGVVTDKNPSVGEVYVTVQNGFEIKELHDVQITDPVNKASLYYNSSEQLWRDTTAALLVSDTVSMLSKYVNTYSNQTGINGNKTFNNVITIDSATVTGKLLVNTNISDAVKITSNTNSTNLELANNSGSSVSIKSSNKNMILQTDTTALVYLNGDNKKVGILTMTPQQELEVAGNVRIDSLNNNLTPFRLIGSTNNNDLTNVNLGEGLSFLGDTLKVDLTIIDTAIAASSITLAGHVTGTGSTNSTVNTIINNGVVTNDMLAGNISDSKLNTITTAGKISNTAFASQTANTVLAAPNGSNGTPTFRLLASTDIPNLNYLPLTGGTLTGGLNGTTGTFNTRLGVGSIESPSITSLFTSGTGNQEVHFAHTGNTPGATVTLRLTTNLASNYNQGTYIQGIVNRGVNEFSGAIGTNGSEYIRLRGVDDGGIVGVGIFNTNPSYNLDLTGTFRATGNSLIGGTLGVTSNITANSFIKSGGLSTEFLKANGSVDANTYLTTGIAASTYQNKLNGMGFVKASGLNITYDNTSYLPLTGGTLTGTLNGINQNLLSNLSITDSIAENPPRIYTSVRTGPASYAPIRLALDQNASGGANMFMGGSQKDGTNSTNPNIFFTDSREAYASISGIYTANGSAFTSGHIAFNTTPNITTTSLTERMRITQDGNVSITNNATIGGTLGVTGATTLSNLGGGASTRMVVASTTGVLSTQAIPTGTLVGTDTISLSNRINNRVSLSGNETIGGVKTFSSAITTGGLTLTQTTSGTNKLLGLNSSGGAVGQITVGSGLNLTGDILTATGGSGTVTNVSVGSPANGLSVENPTTTPVISISLANGTSSPGVVSTGTQTFGGSKTFSSNLIVNSISVGKGNNNVSDNTAVGLNALSSITNGNYNVAIGALSLRDNQTGLYNTAIGSQALTSNSSGDYNTAVGQASLYSNVSGIHNTVVGESSAEFITGSRNTALGSQSMYTLRTGTDNITIGYRSEASAINATNQIVIGSEVTGQANNTVTIGSISGKIYNNYTTNATWVQTSDGRLKNIISKDSLGLSFINRLNPITYTWKPSNQLPIDNPYYNVVNNKDTTTVIHGFVAQEIKAALDAENCSTFNGWMKSDDGIEGISREMFINPLVKAIQELSAQIEILKAEIKELKK